MVHVPDEIIMGYADGRVSAEEKAWLESLLAIDPALRDRLQPFLATAPGQLTAFDAVLAAPIPDRLLDTIRATSTAAKKPVARLGFLDRLFPGGFNLLPAAGYAATLLIGVGVGSLLLATAPTDDTLVRADRDGFVAAGRLQVALDTVPSNEKKLDKEGDIRPLLSVRDRDGRICRQYEIVGRSKGPQGLACRENDGDWRIRVLTGGADLNPTTRNASQGESDALDGVVGTVVNTLPGRSELTPVEEEFLIQKGWDAAPAVGGGAGN
jgi:hypothetical protein